MRMGLGIGLGIAHSGARPYAFTNAEAAALVARFTTPPTDARKRLIDTLVGSLKTAGVWAKLDALYVMAAADSQAARRNWIQDAYNLTAVNSPIFTVDRGYTGDGASAYLGTGFTPSTAGGKWAQDDAHLSAWTANEISVLGGVAGTGGSNATRLDPRRTDNTILLQFNDGANLGTGSITTSVGHYIAVRTSGNLKKVRRSKSTVTATTGTASTGLPTGECVFLATSSASTKTAYQLFQGSFGKALSDTEADAFTDALSTYLTAIGAN